MYIIYLLFIYFFLLITWLTVTVTLLPQVPGQHHGGGWGGDQVCHFPLGTGEKLEAAFSLLHQTAGQAVGSHRLPGRRQQNLLWRGNGALTHLLAIYCSLCLVFLDFSNLSPTPNTPRPPKVMAIWPSHFAWQRERSEKHSGAQRRYGEKTFSLPRSRTALQGPCSLCECFPTANQLVGPSLHTRISHEGSALLSPVLAVESTPLSIEARQVLPRRNASHCSVEDLQVSSRCPRFSTTICWNRSRRGGG